MDTIVAQPLLSEKVFLFLVAGFFVIAVVVAICATVVFRKDSESIDRFVRTDITYILTILVVVCAVTLLGLQGILDTKAISAILGGVVGYVLGSMGKRGS